MACGYDTQTVLEMLFDIDTDNGINSDGIHSDSCVYELRNYTFTTIYTYGLLSVKMYLLFRCNSLTDG